MAGSKDLNYTYSTIDKIFRLSFGESADFSGAKYDGNFSISLEEAQRRKHEFISNSLNIQQGSKVLDMGCGWGPFLNFIRKKGAIGVGLTLSEGQCTSCVRNGLDVHVMDCRNVKPEHFGMFDAVCSVGAFEHFTSPEDYLANRQDVVYDNFFKNVSELIPFGGRFFLQTMVFGRNMLPYDQLDINADKNSDAYILALMMKQFPGSWLPYGDTQVLKNAQPYFRLVSSHSGRLDYIETIEQWRKKFRAFNLQKYLIYGSLLPKYLYDDDFRHRVEIFRVSPNKICFERELFEHYRFVFEKL